MLFRSMNLGLNCLLLRSGGQTILIESGVGGKPGDRAEASPAEHGTLIDRLAGLGLAPADIDVVVHPPLHSHHCGWNTPPPRHAPRTAPQPPATPPALLPTAPAPPTASKPSPPSSSRLTSPALAQPPLPPAITLSNPSLPL